MSQQPGGHAAADFIIPFIHRQRGRVIFQSGPAVESDLVVVSGDYHIFAGSAAEQSERRR